jgi:hypothetical protein
MPHQLGDVHVSDTVVLLAEPRVGASGTGGGITGVSTWSVALEKPSVGVTAALLAAFTSFESALGVVSVGLVVAPPAKDGPAGRVNALT